MSTAGLRFYTQVTTPLGPGRVIGRMEDGRLFVQLNRDDYTPERWKELVPAGGPCISRSFPADEVKVIEGVKR